MIQRTSAGLSEAIFNEFDQLEAGKSTPQLARAKSSLANSIISISRLEMEYARFVGDARSEGGAGLLVPLRMALGKAEA